MHDLICIIELYLILLLHRFDGLEQGRCQCKELLTYDLSILSDFRPMYKYLVLESFILAYPLASIVMMVGILVPVDHVTL
jgi:hypothetical protein